MYQGPLVYIISPNQLVEEEGKRRKHEQDGNGITQKGGWELGLGLGVRIGLMDCDNIVLKGKHVPASSIIYLSILFFPLSEEA